MIMTREEAIAEIERLLDCAKKLQGPQTFVDFRPVPALEMALTALRPVSREQVEKVANEWDPCEFCGEWIGGDCTPREKDAGYKIYAGYTKQVAVDDFWEDETENLNFCPVCGRPLTDEAVEMMMERLETMRDETETD